MKNFKSNRKSTGAASAASKACAWILSIMLVVTGMGPSFASNAKADKDGVVKTAAKAKASSKTKEEGNDNAASQEKTAKKPSASKKDVSSLSKKQKTPKDKADKNGKKKRFKNKRYKMFKLNESGNVYAEIVFEELRIKVSISHDDRNIDRKKWGEMVKALGGSYNENNSERIDWSNASGFDKLSLDYYSGVYLPKDSSYFFYGFKKDIEKDSWSKKIVVDNVENMSHMFEASSVPSMNLSNWKLNSTLLGDSNKMQNMLTGCSNLEWLKTPVGLKTSISGANNNFKIVKLKKGSAAVVESENKNLNNDYEINSAGDKDAAYHIYRKDTHVGVTFDKNSGDSDSFRNHEIVKKGKAFNELSGEVPSEVPKKEGYIFTGWAYNRADKAPTFDRSKNIDDDITLYAVYKNIKEEIPLNDSGNVYVLLKIEVNGKITLEVKAKNLSGDMQIDRSKWNDMARKLGAYYKNDSSGFMLSWGSVVSNINFEANGIYLPTDSSYLFCGLRGEIKGCEKVNTSKVTDM